MKTVNVAAPLARAAGQLTQALVAADRAGREGRRYIHRGDTTTVTLLLPYEPGYKRMNDPAR